MKRKIPLAWLQLTREKTRLAVALAGIAFADILMFMQLGFREALYNSNVRFHQSLDGDIVFINPQSNAMLSMKTFSERRLDQTLAFDAVQAVYPIYIDFAGWKNPDTGKSRLMQVTGINPRKPVLDFPGVKENLEQIKLPDVLLFDRGSRPEFGKVVDYFQQGKTVSTEVGGRKIKVGGIIEMGASFAADGNAITSDLNFLRIFKTKNRKLGLIDLGLVKLKPGANTESVLKQLRLFFYKEVKYQTDQEKKYIIKIDGKDYRPDDVKILTKQEYIEFEKDYWGNSTPIGFIFTLGTIIGFVVGTVIVYQILYSEVADHLPEYATLKAMGYRQRYLLLVVFQEALMLAVIGYMPGFAFAIFQYTMVRNATLLPLIMTVERAVTVLILTIMMCTISGGIAVRKLQAADPADIF